MPRCSRLSALPPLLLLVFGAPDIRESDVNEVVDSLESGWLGTGPKVARFEQACSELGAP